MSPQHLNSAFEWDSASILSVFGIWIDDLNGYSVRCSWWEGIAVKLAWDPTIWYGDPRFVSFRKLDPRWYNLDPRYYNLDSRNEKLEFDEKIDFSMFYDWIMDFLDSKPTF